MENINMGLRIIYERQYLEFIERPIEKTGLYRNWKSFKLKLSKIKVIGIRGGILIDDEELAILLIDENANIYGFSWIEMDTSDFHLFESIFAVDIEKARLSLSYSDHRYRVNKIIYPIQLEGKPIFKESERFLWPILKYFFPSQDKYEPNSDIGVLTDTVLNYLGIEKTGLAVNSPFR